MKLFNAFFKNKEETKEVNQSNVNWIPLNSMDQLEVIKEESKNEAILIFKHSTRCGISKMVLKQFENLFGEEINKIKVYYLDLLNYRVISDEISTFFQLIHQSPQLLVIKNEVLIFHASHYDITEIDLKKI